MSARGFIPVSSSDGGSGAAGFPIWYYVDASGQTQGAYTLQQLTTLFYTGHINENVYVWNGHDVKTWIELRSLPHVLSFIRDQRMMMKPLTASSATTGKFFHDPSSGAPSAGYSSGRDYTHEAHARMDPVGASSGSSFSSESELSDTDRGDLATEDRRAVIRSKKARPKKPAGSGASAATRESPKERAHTVGTIASFAGGGYSSPPRAVHVMAAGVGPTAGSQQHMHPGWHAGGAHSYGAGPARFAAATATPAVTGPYGGYPPPGHGAPAGSHGGPMGYPPVHSGGAHSSGARGPPTMATSYDVPPLRAADYSHHSQSARTLSSSRPGSRRGSKSDEYDPSGGGAGSGGSGRTGSGVTTGSKRSLAFRDRTQHQYSATVTGSVRGLSAVPPPPAPGPPGPPGGDPPPMKAERSGRGGGHGYSQVPSHTLTDVRAKPILSKFEAKGKRQDIIGEHKRYAKALEERSQTLREALDTKVRDLEQTLQSALDSQLMKWERALQKVDLLETKRKMESGSGDDETQAKLDRQVATALDSIAQMSLKPDWDRIEGQILSLLETLQSDD